MSVKTFPFVKLGLFLNHQHVFPIFFQIKDQMPCRLRSNILYKFLCGRCNATYYNKTYWNLSVRVGEHSGVSPITGKKLKSKKSTAVKDHMLFCDHILSIDEFKILATSDPDFHVKIK